jgi:hypothetical protein
MQWTALAKRPPAEVAIQLQLALVQMFAGVYF